MRILYLHQFDLNLAGGSGVYLRALYRELTEQGHEVVVVSARHPDRYGCSSLALPFEFTLTFGPEIRAGERTFDEFTLEDLQRFAGRAADAASPVIADGRVDLILVNHIGLLAVSALHLYEAWGVPYRVISYGTDTELLERDERYVDFVTPAVSGADRVFAISHFVAGRVAALLPARDVCVLGGAVDRDVFHPSPSEPKRYRRVSFAGRLVTEKGVHTLLGAMEELNTGVTLEIAGEGPLRREIEERVAGSTLAGRVALLGYVPTCLVPDVIRRSTVFCVPSLWEEPLGLVVLEALACGTPVVASAVGGIPEMLDHDVNGLLVEPGDVGALADALRCVIDDADTYRRLRDGCLTRTPIRSYRDLALEVLRSPVPPLSRTMR